ncbi:MAG TPA: hypothetical protein VMW03_04070 [Candidatus Krumholzibacteriaceae bacterium]|nr:hypothetical protein [Candidatus Krumholzibacteriaceae bacterium]
MNSKKLITLLVLTTLFLSIIPVVHADVTIDTATPASGAKGDTIVVEGAGVPAGYVVELYWDDVTISWNGVKGKLNSTTADSGGDWEIWFDVPEATIGTHWLWIKAPASGNTDSMSFAVLSKVSLSANSGLAAEKVTVDFYGYANNKEMATLFVASGVMGTWIVTSVGPVSLGSISAGETEYDGTITNIPIASSTVTIYINAVAAFTDDGGGNLVQQAGFTGDGKINYVTGDWEFEVTAGAVPADPITVIYDYFSEGVDDTYILSTSGITSTIGTLTGKRVTIPSASEGAYYIVGYDGKANYAVKSFSIGSVIEVDKDEVKSGELLTVEGRGFTTGGLADIAECALYRTGVGKIADAIILDDEIDIRTDGSFDIQVVMPDGPKKDDDYYLYIEDTSAKNAQADLEITALSSIEVSPEYGPQGSRTSISGENFPRIRGETILVELHDTLGWVADIDDYETNSDGTFEGEFRIPTQPDGEYSIVAYAEYDDAPLVLYNIEADADFRIGTILVLLSDDDGPSGMKVILTGSGFTDNGEWNASFGDIELFDTRGVTANGLLDDGGFTPAFYVPQVSSGEYDIIVWDESAEIQIIVLFEVTATTTLEFSTYVMPTGFNVSIYGESWIQDPTSTFSFTLFNDTDDWDVEGDILQHGGTIAATTFVRPDEDGVIEAWWEAYMPGGDDLDKGVYYMNVTDDTEDFFMQLTFTVGDEHVVAQPRKATFRIGDTVSLVLQHSFGNRAPVEGGDVRVYDPDGTLYWDGDPLITWTKVGMYYLAPISSQTAGNNPMMLLDDAPLGAWTYKWREDDGDVIKEGIFNVEAAAADVLNEQIEDLNSAIDDLTSDISAVTDAVAGVQSNVNSAVQAANAAVEAANAAVQAVNAVAATAGDAATAAQNAADAATDAKNAANGLTTLVYGAIGASLVAALAAIVSLMQISRRIAG